MTPEDENTHTLKAYDQLARLYIQQTPAGYTGTRLSLKMWIDHILEQTKPRGYVLEIGSGTPRDARYIRSKGYRVQCSDAAPGFISYLRDQGELPIFLDITKDSPPEKYDLIFANAVMPHIPYTQMPEVIQRLRAGLNSGGILAFNVKQGEGSEWIDEKLNRPRFVNYWQPHEIYNIVRAAGFEIISIYDGVEGERPSHIWTRITAQK